MKNLLYLLLIAPFWSAAQDCNIKKETDQFTQTPKLTTGFMPVNAGINRVLLSVDANSKEIDFFIAMNAAGAQKCFDDASTAVIFFDSSRVKANYRNTGTMNCEGMFHFTFKNLANTPSALNRLAISKIASIRLTGTGEKVYDITLNEAEKIQFMNAIACLTKEAKTLIK